MPNMILRPLRIWQRGIQDSILSASAWYRNSHARRSVREISDGNASRTVEIEQQLLRLGPPIVPVLVRALEQVDLSEYQKRSIIRVLVGIGDPRGLGALCRLIDDDAEPFAGQVRKDLRVLCLRLDRKGQLPDEYRAYLGRPDGTSSR
jgi:hypothetical protein